MLQASSRSNPLIAVLARRPASSAAELAASLGVSVPTVHRLLQQTSDVVTAGKARRARYALMRPLRGVSSALPLYAIDRAGGVSLVGSLAPLRPEGSMLSLADTPWPVPEEARDGWWDGLPYPLYQMRPQGYMGRQFARAEHRQLQVGADPREWNDDDILHVLGQRGVDLSGNLILGDLACELWLAAKAAPGDPIPEAATSERYLALAEQAVAAGSAGSSAAGEFPKFTARRSLAGSMTPHVLVKFSGADASATVQRWSDLLVCEHLALGHAAALAGLAVARSRILQAGGRTFLEVERFDRHGDAGRSPLCGLDLIDAALVGDTSAEWPRLCARLLTLGLLDKASVAAVERLWWYGRLIGNTDMHTGNLSFVPHEGRLGLAPVYDMLPMRYAPLAGGEVPAVPAFQPVLPLPTQRDAWASACRAAVAFWRGSAADTRIGEAFRAICASNADALLRLQDHA